MRSGETWAAVGLDEIEAIDWRGLGLTWRPVRSALGADIVGMGGFTAERAGETIVEPHTESADGRGHQEIYVVLRGRARFTVDGAGVEAPAGTLIRVDPEVHREAVALEPDTAVLVLGGESTYEPSASEWIERLRPHIGQRPDRAEAILAELRETRPRDRAVEVGEALLAVGRGDETAARVIVGRLVAEAPAIRAALERDPDLADLLPVD